MVAVGSSGNKQKRPPHIDAIAGAFAGAAARFVVGPLDVLKIRFQVQIEPILRRQSSQTATLDVIGSKYTGLKQAFATVLREEGIAVWASLLTAAVAETALSKLARRLRSYA